jgi:ribosomal protein S27E
MKRDIYSRARGGWSRILDIRCESCNAHLCYYQKDGSGHLKRMYIDRMMNFVTSDSELVCKNCSASLGVKIVYKKENRPAYRLFAGAVKRKIIKNTSM